ncbi:MAG TPA: putative toxin-antitoxin system toxin component, PIN family [Pyrinomonadaceae bacterium]|nr:putative toxin-antitoxin system toxin component, PIN family [Pyrinomonadaceae bacterium]
MPEPLVVFDCVVFLQGLIKESGPAVTCLEHFEEGRFRLAISPEILVELHDVLYRSSLQQAFSLLTKVKADRLIELLLLRAKLFRDVPRRFELPRDPDDESYLNLAIEAEARFLVTRDRDLLDLMRWDTKEGRDFQSRFRQLKILDLVAFLKEIEASEKDA